MNTIVEIINDRIKARGMTQVYICDQIHMNPDLLSRTLQGSRKLKADEFVNLCQVLDLKLEDFDGCRLS